jgi:hypothetical protein
MDRHGVPTLALAFGLLTVSKLCAQLRPIVTTALATIAGMLPISLPFAAGYKCCNYLPSQ